jgi:hypothetical protein
MALLLQQDISNSLNNLLSPGSNCFFSAGMYEDCHDAEQSIAAANADQSVCSRGSMTKLLVFRAYRVHIELSIPELWCHPICYAGGVG